MERRLTAILAADIVGYSRLMGADEAGTLAQRKEIRSELLDKKIAEHQGRIVKIMGDGILAEFPSVVSAVACAAEIQQGMQARNASMLADRRIEFRVGINLGDVIVEGDDIYGDGVNVAARLQTVAAPAGIAVTQSVRDQVGNRLNCAFEDCGGQQLKNIDKPVRVYNVLLQEAALTGMRSTNDPCPSVAVLPFTNMSGDPEQEYFSDGITEDIITDLSKVSGLFVIARNTAFTYKAKAVKVDQVGRELGVAYVLEGSVRKAGQRVRVTGELINANNGGHVWADRYDRNLTDIFAIQDEITHAIVQQLKVKLLPQEKNRSRNYRPIMWKRTPTICVVAISFIAFPSATSSWRAECSSRPSNSTRTTPAPTPGSPTAIRGSTWFIKPMFHSMGFWKPQPRFSHCIITWPKPTLRAESRFRPHENSMKQMSSSNAH
jgi:adenylate cyclase